MNPFQQYLDHGLKLCRIEPGTKGPRVKGWNALENAVASAEGLQGAGLLHAYSGTCAIDIDDWTEAEKCFQEHGIDLMDLLMAPDAVQISSGREGRAKLIYRLGTPLPTVKLGPNKKLELRCATTSGLSVQDVLPGTIHPDTGKPYIWIGDWRNLPALPEKVMQLWKANLVQSAPSEKATSAAEPIRDSQIANLCAELKDLLSRRDPDMDYETWKDVGMICENAVGEAGFAIWDEWSAKGKKYPGTQALRDKWASFGRSPNPLTIAGLRHTDVAADSEFQPVKPAAVANFMEEAKDVNPYLGQALLRSQWQGLPKPSWIVENWIPSDGLGCIWGKPNSGKSFMAIDLGLCIASGKPWRGLPVKQGGVVFIAAEAAYGFRMRVEAAQDARGLLDAPMHVLAAAPAMHDPKQINYLAEMINDLGNISMVIVDTMSGVTAGIDENLAKDMNLFLSYGNKLAGKTRTHVSYIHHSGKDSAKGPRGSIALNAAFGAEFEICNGATHTMRVSKMREADYDQDKLFPFKRSLVDKTCSVEWL